MGRAAEWEWHQEWEWLREISSREIFYLLLHSPDDHNGWSRAMLKPGAWYSDQVCHMSAANQVGHFPFPGTGWDLKQPGHKLRYENLSHHKHPNTLCHNAGTYPFLITVVVHRYLKWLTFLAIQEITENRNAMKGTLKDASNSNGVTLV